MNLDQRTTEKETDLFGVLGNPYSNKSAPFGFLIAGILDAIVMPI